MCGIAGYSLSAESSLDRTLAAQALLAGIAERGEDAVGYASRCAGEAVEITKLRGGASALLDEIRVAPTATEALIHVRDYTKGRPEIEENNHPIRHGAIVGIHNGVISNDDELLAHYGIERETPEMTVDSEAIFALTEHRNHHPRALRELHGTMAAAWLDERRPGALYLARGLSRPLWTGRTATEVFFASTRRALSIVEAVLHVRLQATPLSEGRLVEVVQGRVDRLRRFRPDRRYREPSPSSPVHSPGEAIACLRRLAVITSAAG